MLVEESEKNGFIVLIEFDPFWPSVLCFSRLEKQKENIGENRVLQLASDDKLIITQKIYFVESKLNFRRIVRYNSVFCLFFFIDSVPEEN